MGGLGSASPRSIGACVCAPAKVEVGEAEIELAGEEDELEPAVHGSGGNRM